MKKFLLVLIFMIMALFSFTSCNEDNDITIVMPPYFPYAGYYQPYTTNANGQYVIGGYISGQQAQARALTRAALHEGAGASYDEFALYSWTNDSVVMDKYHGVFTGNTWGYNEDLKYFDNFVPEYNFIGIIPQDAEQTFENGVVKVKATAFAVENENPDGYTDTEEILYASTTVDKDNYPTGASFTFNHANSKIYLKFTSNDPNTKIIDYSPVTAGQPATPEVRDTVDTWFNLKRSYSAVGSATKLKGPGESSYTNAAQLPAALVNEIKSYYSIDGGTPGNYDLHMGNTVWPSSTIKKLRVVKPIPAAYKKTVEIYNTGIYMDFFDGFKYLQDNGYDIQPANSGGKPDVWNYILIDAFENGAAYTIVGFNWDDSNAVPEYDIHITPGTPATSATGVSDIVVLPATSALGDGTDAILSSYPDSANISVSLNGVSFESIHTNNIFKFTKPSGKISTTRVASPTTWYTFPTEANAVDNVGYTVKFSFIYKGTTVYDARVFLPAAHCQWQSGKFYTYIININGRGNGKDTVVDPDAQDPKITNPTNHEITVSVVTINPYEDGGEHEYTIQ